MRIIFGKYGRIFGPDAGGEGGGAGTATEGDEGNGTPPPKTFTQQQLDDIINKKFAKSKTEKENLVRQLETLQQNQNLTAKERDDLQGQIDNLNNSLLTKDQQAAAEREKFMKKHSTELEKANQERESWKSRFIDSTISRAITDAAVSAGAESPEQMVMMFRSASQLVEEKDESGKMTGNFVPMIKFQGVGEDKKPALVEMPIGEAFGKMKEWGLHKNLFKHGANAGTGASGTGGKAGKGGSPGKMPDPSDYNIPEEYQAAYQTWRNDYNLDGTPKNKG